MCRVNAKEKRGECPREREKETASEERIANKKKYNTENKRETAAKERRESEARKLRIYKASHRLEKYKL